jgi:hypothetical protein
MCKSSFFRRETSHAEASLVIKVFTVSGQHLGSTREMRHAHLNRAKQDLGGVLRREIGEVVQEERETDGAVRVERLHCVVRRIRKD